MKKPAAFFLALLCLSLGIWASGNREDGKTGDEAIKGTRINVTIEGVVKSATLFDNVATMALLERLEKEDVVVTTDDYGGFEKVGTFGGSLPTADTKITTSPGEFVLYQGASISFFYEENGWSYTRLGRLDMTDSSEIRAFLQAGKGKTKIILSLPN